MATNKPGYMQAWWLKNRAANLAVRAYRLKNDPIYRAKVRAWQAAYRARKAAKETS